MSELDEFHFDLLRQRVSGWFDKWRERIEAWEPRPMPANWIERPERRRL